MQEKKRKIPLNCFEVILAAILFLFTFYFLTKLLCEPINKHAPNWFFSFWGLLLVIVADCLWLAIMRLCPIKMLRIKMYLSLVIFVISLTILACWVMLNLLGGVW